jgi:hypothetical protein
LNPTPAPVLLPLETWVLLALRPFNGFAEPASRIDLGDVVRVAHRRLNVGVAHVRLDVVKREHLDGQGAEGVAQVVKGEAAPGRRPSDCRFRDLFATRFTL